MNLILVVKCICSDWRRGLPGAILAFVLMTVVSTAALYVTVQWLSYYSIAERDAKSISWSLDCNFADGSKKTVEKVERAVVKEYPQSRVALCASSDALIVVGTNEDAAVRVSARYLHRDSGMRPLDIASSEDFVTDGDPDDGDAAVLDAKTAKAIRVRAGDTCTVGFKTLAETSGSTSTVSYQTVKISALFAPDDNFSGIAMYRPKGHIDASVAEDGDYATDLFVFGLNDSETDRCVSLLKKAFGKQTMSFFKRADEIESAREQIAYNNTTGGFAWTVVAVTSAAIVFISVLETVRRMKGYSRISATLMACGAQRLMIIVSFLLIYLAWFLITWLVVILATFEVSELQTSAWVPPDVYVQVGVLLACIFLASLFIGLLYSMFSLRLKRLIRLVRV